MIDRLTEMINLVSKNKVNRVEIISGKGNKETKLHQLYEGIHNGAFTNDEAAAQTLYGKTSDYEAYRKLKYKLERRLINTLFHIDVSSAQYNKTQTAYYNCHKNLTAVEILLGRTATRSALSIAERTLKIAIEYEFTTIALALIRKLLAHYAFQKKHNAKYNQLRAKEIELSEQHDAESIAMRYRQDIYALYTYQPDKIMEHLATIETYTTELTALMQKHQSYIFCMDTYDILCIRYEITHDYPKVIEICNQAIAFFNKKEHANYEIALFIFFRKNLGYYTALGRYEQAERAALACLNGVEEGGSNWYKAVEHYIVLCLHSQQYVKAYELWLKGVKHKLYQVLSASQRKRWDVYQAYIFYWIKYHNLEVNLKSSFNFRNFLSTPPKHNEAYRYSNIAILVLQILVFLRRKKYNKAADSIKILTKYKHWSINNAYIARSSCFIRMLKVLESSQFNRIGTTRKAARYLQKMAEFPVDVGQEIPKVEPLPYTYLWELILKSLPDNFFYEKN